MGEKTRTLSLTAPTILFHAYWYWLAHQADHGWVDWAPVLVRVCCSFVTCKMSKSDTGTWWTSWTEGSYRCPGILLYDILLFSVFADWSKVLTSMHRWCTTSVPDYIHLSVPCNTMPTSYYSIHTMLTGFFASIPLFHGPLWYSEHLFVSWSAVI